MTGNVHRLPGANRDVKIDQLVRALADIDIMADVGLRGADPAAALRQVREAARVALGLRDKVLPRIRVRITSAPGGAWYEGAVGSEFEVYEWGKGYVLADDYDRGYETMWGHIAKPDAEVVR